MLQKFKISVLTAQYRTNGKIEELREQLQDSSRATRLVDDSTRFLLISLNSKLPESTIRQTLRKWVREGVTLVDTHYAFFGYTENHVKGGRVIFFREDEAWTVERVKKQLGDLDDVFLKHGYGKYAARLGLSFSSTVASLDVASEHAIELPDWRASDGSLHTDGCGMIQDSFAAEICHAHELPADTHVFQVRRGGIKGLLVRYPDAKFASLCSAQLGYPIAPSVKLAYRPSMLKYKGGPTALELNDCSRCPASARLNVQFIVILLTLGIDAKIFEKMMKEHLEMIGCITQDRDTALRYLQGELDAGDDETFGQDVYALLLAHHDLSEPYVEWKLKQFQALQYRSLRKKLNLRVEESCYAYGVVDEDGILQEDEVFINLPGRSGVIISEVMVARNPSYSPGDFRKFRAVYHPALKHHKHCIVFSRNAQHSIPDSMASGDLDGDEYFVTWDPALIPKQMSEPQQRAPSASSSLAQDPPTRITRQSTMEETAVSTFVENAWNRLLGQMANEWSKLAEATPHLAQLTLPLVPLLEAAHDIMKTGGNVAKLEQDFKMVRQAIRQQCAQVSDFKGPVQALRDLVPDAPTSKMERFVCDSALVLEKDEKGLWDRYLKDAREVMPQFNRALAAAIERDKKDGEGDDVQVRSRRDKVRSQSRAERVTKEYQERYFGGGSLYDRCKQGVRASAWYFYGYSQKRQTFAWLGERYLNEIRAHATNGGKPVLYVGSSARKSANMPPLERPASPTVRTETTSEVSNAQPRFTAQVPLPPASQAAMHTVDPVPDELLSVRGNPKPRTPVATTNMPSCPSSDVHGWRVGYANGHVRRYMCIACGLTVGEKKGEDFWEPDFLEAPFDIRGQDNDESSCSERSLSSTIDVGSEEDAKVHAAGSSPRKPLSKASSGGTLVDVEMREETSPCAPPGLAGDVISSVSLRNSIRGIRRSLGLDQPDAPAERSPAARPGAVRASAPQTASAVSSPPPVARNDLSLDSVVQNPKPRQPVATKNIPACRSETHSWDIRANSAWRRYTCSCGTIVKETKSRDGTRWIPC